MIYTWRGASAENVQRFERDFPHTKIIMLEQNYRSTQTILDAAQNIVQRNRLRKDKRLWTSLGSGEKIILHEAYNEEEEGLYTAREIKRLRARGDLGDLGSFPALYRSGAVAFLVGCPQSRAFRTEDVTVAP